MISPTLCKSAALPPKSVNHQVRCSSLTARNVTFRGLSSQRWHPAARAPWPWHGPAHRFELGGSSQRISQRDSLRKAREALRSAKAKLRYTTVGNIYIYIYTYMYTYIYIYTYDLYMFTSISVSLSEGEVSLPSVLECARRFGVAIAGHGPS